MKVFFDNCTAPRLASTLHGFVHHDGHEVYHIKDVPGLSRGRHTSDLEWINRPRGDRDHWIFVSGDGRILRNAAERAAIRLAGLHGFILASSYQRTPINQVAATIVWKWPEMLKITELLAAPSMHEVPIGKNTKLRQLPV